MHFRHVHLTTRSRALLRDLLPFKRATVLESIGEAGLAFEPALARSGYQAQDLMALVRYDLVSLRQVDVDWACAVTTHGRDYAEDTILV